MTGEEIFGVIIMSGVSFLCGGIFFGLGIWATRNKKPMHFWSGSTVDPKMVTDIPAYNRANGIMWKIYSVPYWFSGLCALLQIWMQFFIYVSVLMLLIGVAGIGWLITHYNKICKEYLIR